MSMNNNRLNFKPFGKNNDDEPLDGASVTRGAENERERRLRERAAAMSRLEQHNAEVAQNSFANFGNDQPSNSDVVEYPVETKVAEATPQPVVHQTRPINTIPTPTVASPVQQKEIVTEPISTINVNADELEADDTSEIPDELGQMCDRLANQDRTERIESQVATPTTESTSSTDDEVLLDAEDADAPIPDMADEDVPTEPADMTLSEYEDNTIPYKESAPQLNIDVSSKSTVDDTFSVTDENTDSSGADIPKVRLLIVDENFSTLNNLLINTADKISKKYNLKNATDENDVNAKRFTAEIQNPNGPVFKLQNILTAATAGRDFDQRAINRITDFEAMVAAVPKSLTPKSASSNVKATDIKNKDKVVSGQQARMMLNARLRGMKRIFLYNSGFYVNVRALTNQELNEFINTIQSEDIAYGHSIGAHFYLYSSMHLKKFFADKLTSIVMDSNLQGWTQGSTLQDNISIHDYRTIMWACASLMFKDGVKFTKICAFCTAEETLTINLNKIIFFNYEPAREAYKLICDKKSVTTDDVRKYREQLDFGITHEFTIPGFRIYRKIPNLTEYTTAAAAFINRMMLDVTDIRNKQEMQDYIRFTFFRQYTPWIQKIEAIDEDGELDFAIEDTDAILAFFETCPLEETDFIKQMEEYIQKTMMTFIGFPYVECPTCHKVPTDIVNGFVAYDIESGFFTMSVMKFQEVDLIAKD